MKRILLLTLTLLAGGALPAAAQSLFSTRGLGTPLDAVDARSRLLGGVGTGLYGLNMSLVNPADPSAHIRRGLSVSLQPVTGRTRFGGEEDDFHGTRFPVISAIYPFAERFVLSAGYGALYDQSWGIVSERTEAPEGTDVMVRDFVRATGGISQARVGMAYSITPRVAVGAAAGLYTGTLARDMTRIFPESPTLAPFTTTYVWEYGGPFGALGVRWDPDPAMRVAASLTLGGELRARGIVGEAEDVDFAMPNRLNVGASGLISPTLLVAAGVERAMQRGGSGHEDGTAARDTWRAGGGLESTAARLRGRVMPIRLGGQWAQLPWHGADEEPPSEWSAGMGLGLVLAGDDFGPLAQVDAGFERGGRSGLATASFADGLQENFWRFTFSVSVFGR
jgi:hypothetical protein